MSRFLVTGGCGFAGSHLVEELVKERHEVMVIDVLTYAGQLRNLTEVEWVDFVHYDLSRALPALKGKFDAVIHNAAQSHVLRSLANPNKFISANVLGTFNVLEWARTEGCKVVYVSTDEVFGPAGAEPYHEGDRLKPTNPYSATKAGGEFLTLAYFRSFGVPALITRSCNMFGPRQHPEKFVPKVIGQVLRGETVDIHAHEGRIGTRKWMYVGEQAKALAWLAQHGQPGKAYHVSAGRELSNLQVAQFIAGILGKDLTYRIVEYAWSGHDLDYNLSCQGTPERVNWSMDQDFEGLFVNTVLWYQKNPGWLA